jgi:TonB family protein
METRFGLTLISVAAVLLAIPACSSKAPQLYDSPPILANREEITAAMSAVGAGLETRVVLQVRVDDKGHVREARIVKSSGTEDLDLAAVWIGEQMRFQPAVYKGKAVAALVEVPIRFDVVGQVVRTPKLRNAQVVQAIIARDYPDLRGTARYKIQIGAEGWVKELRTERGSDEQVLQAARKIVLDYLEFWPGYKEGREITAWARLTIEFAGDNTRIYMEEADT